MRIRPVADVAVGGNNALVTRPLLLTCRIFLFAALLLTGFLTLALFATGLWFSPLERPVAALLVLAVASTPIWVVRAIILSAGEESGKRVALHTVAIWSAISLYVLFVFGILPEPIYKGWQWLVA